MRLVLNLPLPAYQGEQALGCCPFGAQARDTINYFHPFLARLLEDHVTAQFKDLRQPGPIAVAYEGLTRREIALLDAPMAQVDSPCRSLTVTSRRGRKAQPHIGPQPWRAPFDHHDRAPALVHNRLRAVTRRRESVPPDEPPCVD